MSSYENKTPEQLYQILRLAVSALIAQGEQAACIYYEGDRCNAVGHGPICAFSIANAYVWEDDPGFHIDRQVQHQTKLPAPPNLLTMTYKGAKKWLGEWQRKFLGYFPKFGVESKKPIWWPIEWSEEKNRTRTKIDMIKIIASLYKHYENVHLELPAGVDLIQVGTNGSSQAAPTTSTTEYANTAGPVYQDLPQTNHSPAVGVSDPIDQESAIDPEEEAMSLLSENYGQMDSPTLHTLNNANYHHCHPSTSTTQHPDWWSDAPLPKGPTATSVLDQRPPPDGSIPASDAPMPEGPTTVPDQRPPNVSIPASPVIVPKRRPNPREEIQSRMKNTVGKKKKCS